MTISEIEKEINRLKALQSKEPDSKKRKEYSNQISKLKEDLKDMAWKKLTKQRG